MNQLEKTNIRKGLLYAPELLLLIGGLVCLVGEWLGASSVNGVMIFGILAVVTLLIWKNKYLALAIAMVLGAVSVFFMLAVFAEYREFPSESRDGWYVLLMSMLLFGSLFAISLIMPKKYFSRP